MHVKVSHPRPLADLSKFLLMYSCLAGDVGLKEYASRTTRPKKGKDDASTAAQQELLKKHVRVFFPSRRTVEASRGGRNVGDHSLLLFRRWNMFPRYMYCAYAY